METNIKTVEVEDIDSIFDITPKGDDIIIDEKKNVFSTEKTDLSFIDDKSDPEVNEVIDEITKTDEDEPLKTDETKQVGRPKIQKSGLVETFNKLFEKGTLVPFDGEEIENYSVDDFIELINANFEEKINKVKEETPQQFFSSLPEEFQVAAKYFSEGGTDVKGILRALSQTTEIRSLDPEIENDQELIVRQYLKSTNFGSDEEIQEEIDTWKDMDKLGEKALKFKPKLDKFYEQNVEKQIELQRIEKEKQQKLAETYVNNIYETLKVGELNGVKLDRKTQSLLYEGLTRPSHPSITGRQTNLLGHLLEKYQYVEPRPDLIAEALWLLSDPDSYKEKIKSIGSKESIKETVRTLKTEESRRSTNTADLKDEKPQSKLTRPNGNFFKR